MEGNCQVNDAVYKCDVIRTLLKKMYLGLAGGEKPFPLPQVIIYTQEIFH